MKLKPYHHGVAFEETFKVTLRGEVEGNPVGWGSSEHAEQWLQEQIHEAVRQAVARFYQCQLHGTTLKVEL